jgi:hypothetical protein
MYAPDPDDDFFFSAEKSPVITPRKPRQRKPLPECVVASLAGSNKWNFYRDRPLRYAPFPPRRGGKIGCNTTPVAPHQPPSPRLALASAGSSAGNLDSELLYSPRALEHRLREEHQRAENPELYLKFPVPSGSGNLPESAQKVAPLTLIDADQGKGPEESDTEYDSENGDEGADWSATTRTKRLPTIGADATKGIGKYSKLARATQNVSPTRREGKVVLLDYTFGYIFDEKQAWFLRFDPRDQVATFKVSSVVTYNRLHGEEELTAIRLMKLVDPAKGRYLTSPSLSVDSDDDTTSLPNLDVVPMPPREITTVTVGSGVNQKQIDVTSFPAEGLEYFMLFAKAGGRAQPPSTKGTDMDQLIGALEAADDAELAKKEAEKKAQLPKEKLRSIFEGGKSRAVVDDSSVWGKAQENLGHSARYGSSWFSPPRSWTQANLKPTGEAAALDKSQRAKAKSWGLRRHRSGLTTSASFASDGTSSTAAFAPDYSGKLSEGDKPFGTSTLSLQSANETISSDTKSRQMPSTARGVSIVINSPPRSPVDRSRRNTRRFTQAGNEDAPAVPAHQPRVYSISRIVRRMTIHYGHPLQKRLQRRTSTTDRNNLSDNW